MSTIPFERLFSMSAFEALRCLRRYQKMYPEHKFNDLLEIIIRVDPDVHTFDLEAGSSLMKVVGDKELGQESVFYQNCIEIVILSQQPIWARIMTMGRQKFTQKLSRDEQQCFREAGLLVEPPTENVITWWDRITGQVRLSVDQAKLERGRIAERLTLEREARRLKELGIKHSPIWIAIEDNTAGYDVLSYDPGVVEPTNRLIEVKSTIASPLRFYLTRTEWEQARRFGESYHFHIWNLQKQPYTLFERTVAQIAPHIPTDNKEGRWKNAEIPIGANANS